MKFEFRPGKEQGCGLNRTISLFCNRDEFNSMNEFDDDSTMSPSYLGLGIVGDSPHTIKTIFLGIDEI
ncbi:ATP-dependent RNA helicase DRS1 [Gossypium arboreum]|uniref:ATP-dependent RNA helicase DRS1 n=1 Tax=Gossypium arboreum TaxID=29729 RepID=A0A0B0PB04_GOSAR|nr:ATP-dependent RNA helicase DRS1 [Gossypium arboreum]